ncbi:MAG: RNA polymerase sigma factor [Pseudonocardia sp.]
MTSTTELAPSKDQLRGLPVSETGNAELLSAARDGDPTAWEEIVCRYGRIVMARVCSYRLQPTDALDAVQMTWLRLAESLHQIRFPDRLGGWLATTAGRECLRILRQSKHTAYATESMMESIADPSSCLEENIVDADTAQLLWDLVAELPSRRRRLLKALFTDDPRPYCEVAEAVGIPTGSIGPTRARALRQLRQLADERGLGLLV